MTEAETQGRARALSRQWQGLIVPVEDEVSTRAQRERVVAAIGGAIGRSAERRGQERRARRLLTGLSLAAGVALAVGLGHYTKSAASEQTAGIGSGTAKSGARAVSGVVTLIHGSHSAVLDHAALEVGDSLSTAPEATAEVRLTDLVVADISGSSEVAVVAPKSATHRLRLDRGRLQARVDDRPSSTPKLIVETPDVEVVVTGTAFQVDVTHAPGSADSVTAVSVTKGRVVVRRSGAEIAAVTAGHSWTSAPLAGPAGAAEPAPAAAAAGAASRPVGERAASLPGTAAAAARSGTLAEENSLFQAAVDARNRGADREALDRLGGLLSRFPGSPLAGEARVERMRALQRLGQPLDAAREARRYLADYPGGFAHDEARRLVMQDGTSASSANLPAP
jgi:hypothetical protein